MIRYIHSALPLVVTILFIRHFIWISDPSSPILQIVNDPLCLPDDLNPTLKNLLEGILCKGAFHFCFPPSCDLIGLESLLLGPKFGVRCADPRQRLSLRDVSEHEWVIGDHGPVPQHDCWCQRMKLQTDASIGNSADTLT